MSSMHAMLAAESTAVRVEMSLVPLCARQALFRRLGGLADGARFCDGRAVAALLDPSSGVALQLDGILRRGNDAGPN